MDEKIAHTPSSILIVGRYPERAKLAMPIEPTIMANGGIGTRLLARLGRSEHALSAFAVLTLQRIS